MASADTATDLLWTGGWDSTFQLLRLLLVEERRVAPVYLIDAHRASTGMELLAIKRIKDSLFERYPLTRSRLGPSRYFAVADIPPDQEVTRAFDAIRRTDHIGTQYDWLARFCKANLLTNIQMCVLGAGIRDLVSLSGSGPAAGGAPASFRTADAHVVFQYFSFPLLGVSKQEMAAIAADRGWTDIMAMTWFCHKPRFNRKPCGKCKPCVTTMADGLRWRVPRSSRLLSAVGL